jgi:hypothetical protein
LINPSLVSGVLGDPHIHTLDGSHYTLLPEGSFLLWHFGVPQPHVEWQIFAHYAGRQSFTKGLSLVDTSSSEPSSMDITSERCEWQTQSNSKKWSSVNSTVPEVLLSGPSSCMKLVGNQREDMKLIQPFIAEKVLVATLKVSRQGRHIMKLHMAKKWKAFVSGEFKGKAKSTRARRVQCCSWLREKTKNLRSRKLGRSLVVALTPSNIFKTLMCIPRIWFSARCVTPKRRLMPGLSARNTWDLSRIPATSSSVSTMSALAEEKVPQR